MGGSHYRLMGGDEAEVGASAADDPPPACTPTLAVVGHGFEGLQGVHGFVGTPIGTIPKKPPAAHFVSHASLMATSFSSV